MSTTVASASAVEAASTMEARSATVESTSAVVSAACEAMPVSTSGISAAPTIPMSVAPATARVTTTPSAAIISAIPELRRMTPVIPRTRTNKHAAYEPIRPVIAVRRTGIRIIVIVPIRANRRTGRIGGTDSDPNAYLRL